MALSKKTQKGLTVALASKRLKGLGAVLAAKNTMPAKKGRDSGHGKHPDSSERRQMQYDLDEFRELRERAKPTLAHGMKLVKHIYRFKSSKTRVYRVVSLVKLLLKGYGESELRQQVPVAHHDEVREASEFLRVFRR